MDNQFAYICNIFKQLLCLLELYWQDNDQHRRTITELAQHYERDMYDPEYIARLNAFKTQLLAPVIRHPSNSHYFV